MKRKKTPRSKWLISEETLDDFLRLSTAERLRWLDEARKFYLAVVPDRTKRLAGRLRKERGL